MAAKGLASHRCSVTNRSARGHVRPRDGTIALPRVSKQPLANVLTQALQGKKNDSLPSLTQVGFLS